MTDRTLDFCFVAPYAYRYLNPDNNDPAGGAQRQQYMLARELDERGYDVGFIVEDVGQPIEQYIDGLLVTTGCPIDVSLLTLPAQTIELLRAIRRVDAETYYVRGAPRLAIATALGCRLLRRRFLFCVANDADVERDHLRQRYNRPIRRAYVWAMRQAHTVITQTTHQQDLLEKSYGITSRQIPNGYTLPDDENLLPATDREFVLWVGSSDPTQKQPRLFLELAASLPEVDFVMVSKPMPHQAEFHDELATEAATIFNLDFVGAVPPDEVHDYYRRASLVVNTSSHEGFPNTFLEAWRYATPVVSLAFDLGGILQSERAGWYAGSVEQLPNTVGILVADQSQRQQLGERARSLVESEFSLTAATNQYETLIK